MPELPDITVYCEALERYVLGRTLIRLELLSPFLLRTASPAPEAFEGLSMRAVRRVGKRIALGLDDDHWAIMHLMIAGRLKWSTRAPRGRGRNVLARFHFESGVLSFTEAGTKKRASLHLAHGPDAWRQHDPAGLEVLDCSFDAFFERLTASNHTLKRALTDPRLFSGIGNAYSDEILHAARLSPVQRTGKLDIETGRRLHDAIRAVLTGWTERLRSAAGEGFPSEVTAFREGMAVHGRYGQACPICGTTVQRIRYADNELNYCPRCQTDGRIYADRSLSRLLKQDWPRTIDELERSGSF